MNIDTAETDELEQLLKQGKILDIGEVVLEDEDEQLLDGCDPQIPVYLGETITYGMLPEAPLYNEKGERMFNGEVPELAIYRGGIEKSERPNTFLRYRADPTAADSMRKRFKHLAGNLGIEKTAGTMIREAFGARTRRSTMQAFGDYMHDYLLSRFSGRTLSAPEFVVAANIAILNLRKGYEFGTGRPVRNSLRQAFHNVGKQVYDEIKTQLPGIARAVTTTRFAIEVRDIGDSAYMQGKSMFDYARERLKERGAEARYMA